MAIAKGRDGADCKKNRDDTDVAAFHKEFKDAAKAQ